jgi:DNA polymerase-3 subunit delta
VIHLQLLNQIKQGKLPPITYIYGAEPLFIDELMNAAEVSLLPEAERSFNQTVVYGRDVNVPQLVNMCMQCYIEGSSNDKRQRLGTDAYLF